MHNDCGPTFLELFFRIAEQYRDKPAILVEGKTAYTYGQLLSKAFRIAHLIRNAGIGESLIAIDEDEPSKTATPETAARQPLASHCLTASYADPVAAGEDAGSINHAQSQSNCLGNAIGIGISKSADYIASMLGAWIAGAAFVPLDPTLPKERAQFIVNQSSMRAVLTKSTASFANLGVESIIVDENWTDDFDFSSPRTAIVAIPADRLAYIIYTSGSTGRPKGVMVTHSGIVNLLVEQIAAFKLDSQSRCLFILSTNFDASVSDIGTALLSGSTLCIEPQDLLQPGPTFLPLLSERKITHMDIPPSLLKTIPCQDAPATLQTIIIGGEACAPDTVRAWAQKCLVVNVYGPTEATVCTSLGACDSETWDRPLIGQPLKNIDYQILDENLNPTPIGTPGELYIGGIGIAKGYVDEPDLTAKKFISLSGKRLYRTGDLVVRCDDGEYQFLGRVDRQFKLRGMLIEPEEIESRLAIHPGVQQAAVLKRPLREGFPGEKLIAFVLPRENKQIDAPELRQHLVKFLPPWMVPQIFEFVDQMPMKITGKIDLSSLRTRLLQAIPDAAPSPATTPTQEILLAAWKQILGIESIGIHDDFYALGADSLNIIEAVLASHVRGLTVSPDLFALHSTISELSEAIDQQQSRKKIAPDGGKSEIENANGGFLTSQFLRDDVRLGEQFFATAATTAAATAGAGAAATGAAATATSNSQSQRANAHVDTDKLTASAPKIVLMTGATGFLGSRLLHELLQKTDARFHCLIRANSEQAAMTRLRNAIAAHGKTFSANDESRIHPVLGDLTKTSLGLSAEVWNKLTSEVDTVFHSAATVNMVKDYYELKGANVDGTREIIRFVLEGEPKQLHYASTLSVFVATNRNTGVASESDRLDGHFEVYGGYAQTKFAAELLLREAEQNGVSVSFYRFGLLTGDSKSGLSAKDDFLNLFARGLSTLGMVPESDSRIQVDITPVDYAAQAMAQIAVEDSVYNRSNTYHIANQRGLPLTDLVTALRNVGFKFYSMPSQVFLSQLTHKSKFTSEESAACLALCRTHEDSNSFSKFRSMDLFQATDIRFDCSNTKSALEATSIRCPLPTVELIELYFQKALVEKLSS